MSAFVVVPLFFLAVLLYAATTGLIDEYQNQKLYASLISGGRIAAARVEQVRNEPYPGGDELYQLFEYAYVDESGGRHTARLVKYGSRRFGKQVFAMTDYGIDSIAVGDEFNVTYLAASPRTHLPIVVTPGWKRGELVEQLVASGGMYVFCLFLFGFILQAIGKTNKRELVLVDAPGTAIGKDSAATITIILPRSYFATFFMIFWLAGWTFGFISMGLVFLIPYVIGASFAIFMLKQVIGAKETITLDGIRLIDRRIRVYATKTEAYELALIRNMRAEQAAKKESGLRFAFEYGGAKKTLGIRPLDTAEARTIAADLARFVPVDTKAFGEPGPWINEHSESFVGSMLQGKLPDMPADIEAKFAEETKRESTPKPLMNTVWGRSRRENMAFIGREIFGLHPLAILAAITWYYFHFKGGMPVPVFLLVAPAWFLFGLAYLIGWGKMIRKLSLGLPLEQKGTFRDDIRALKDYPGIILACALFGFILWAVTCATSSTPKNGPHGIFSRVYSVFPAAASATDDHGNVYELHTFTAWRLQKFTADGRFLWALPVQSWKGVDGRLALDTHDNIYVLSHNVEKFDPDGKLLQIYPGINGVKAEWEVTGEGEVTNHAANPPPRL